MNVDIIEIRETDFEAEVIEYSNNTPVAVDFWAPWCAPCRTLGPLLERLAEEAHGAFRLAKVNVDDNPGLSARFGIQGIPMVIGFREGKVKGQFIGAQPESAVRKFLRDLRPDPADRLLAEATGLITARHWAEAEKAARNALALNAGSSAAALVLMKSLLAQGKGSPALDVLRNFPPGNEVVIAQKLEPLAALLAEADAGNPLVGDDLETEYLQAARLLTMGNFPAALDGLLDILRRDKRHRNDEVRRVFLAVLEILGEEDPLTRQYRDELASALF
jgi:putative thioredoxin